MAPETIPTIAVVAVAAIAVAFDLRTRRIPNELTFGAAAAAAVFALGMNGPIGLASAALAWVLGVLLFLPFFAVRGMGAGDVKLLAALGAWLGPVDTIYMAIFASIAGGVVALVIAFAQGYLRRALSNIWLMLMHWRVCGPGPVPGLTLRDTAAPRLAYAIPIGVGAMCTLWRN